MIKWFLIFILVLILIFVVFYNVLTWTEEKLLYYPSRKNVWRPKINYKQVYLNLEDCDDVCYKSKEKQNGSDYISGWHFNNYPGAKTVLFCHGNTGNITHRKYIIDLCRRFKLNLFVFDYRGFGKSDSFAYKTFFKEDGECAYNYLRYHCDIPSRKIIVWGESIGGVSAAWIAGQHHCKALILMCTFSSLDDILTYKFDGKGKKAIKLLTGLASWRTDTLRIKDYLRNVKCPVVVVHSAHDELIPYACSWNNYHSVKHSRKLHVKIKGGHSSPDIKSYQFRKVFEFCNLPTDLSGDTGMSEILADLKTFAERYNYFMDSS